jgi:Tfp pilus assembly protein PilX
MSIINKKELNRRGFASIVVALILVVVLSLITVGFVQLSRREQQNALNQQLATQASYAAESTINKVVSTLNTLPSTVSSNTDCSSTAFKDAIPDSTDIKITCVLINKTPTTSQYGGVAANNGKVMKFKTDANVDSIDFSWGSSTIANNANFLPGIPATNPAAAGWTRPAVMQLSITPISSPISRDNLINNTYNIFLYPSTGGINTITATRDPNARKIEVKCDRVPATNDTCKLKITTAGTFLAASEYVVHFISLYDTSDVKISANGIVGGTSQQLQLQNSQAEIDVTARAQDVVKRIKVRVPINAAASSSVPDYALQANNICKRMKTSPAGSSFFNPSNGTSDNKKDACDALSD